LKGKPDPFQTFLTGYGVSEVGVRKNPKLSPIPEAHLSRSERRLWGWAMAKRALSPAQSAVREKINRKVLEAVRKHGFQGPD
jgi:hypothetical protein